MTEMQAVYRSLQVNPAKMANLFRKQFELCNVKRGETIALVSDLGTRRPYIMAGSVHLESGQKVEREVALDGESTANGK